MVLNMSVALICQYTALSLLILQSIHYNFLACFAARLSVDYFGIVYAFLITAEAVNMFVKVVLVSEQLTTFH